MSSQIFLSHSSKDAELAQRLAGDLRDAGLDVWVDLDSIRGGDNWLQAIESALNTCGQVLILMTRAARESEWVEREALMALRLRRPIFIALAEDVPLPLHLIERQYNALKDYETGLPDLIADLKRGPEVSETREQQPLPSGVSPDPNEDNFFEYLEQLPQGETQSLIARGLYDWARKEADEISFGGRHTPCFHVRIRLDDKLVTVFSLLAYMRNPAVQIPLDHLSRYPPYTRRRKRDSALRQLNRLLPEEEALDLERANRRPTLPLLSAFDTAEEMEQFKDIISEMIASLRDGS